MGFTTEDLKNFRYTFDDTSKMYLKVTLTGDLEGKGVDGYSIYLDYNLDFPSKIAGYKEAYEKLCILSRDLITKCWEKR